MISLSRLKTIPGRLTAAVRRHGLAAVSKAVVGIVLRQGLAATLRLGGAERPFPWQRPRSAPRPERAGPTPDLDQAYTLDAQGWERWRDIVGAAAAQGCDRDTGISLIVVVRNSEPAAGDLERTAAAIAAMGAGVRQWRPGEATPDAALGEQRFWLFLCPGDAPSPDLPREIAAAARRGVAEVISFDLARRTGDRVQPLLLPGANPTLLQASDYVFSRLVLADSLMAGEGDPGAVQPRWMLDRPAPETRGRWRHIGRPLMMASVSDDDIQRERERAFDFGRRPLPGYDGEPISIVICTKDKGHLVRQLVRRLLAEDPGLVGEVIIVSNNTVNPYALRTLDDLRASSRVQILRRDEPFNFSKLCNAGVRASTGRGPLLFLNDDITPVSEDWLHRLLVRLSAEEVGSVGPLLLYPDERVQHAGVYLGFKGGAGHILRAARLPDNDYLLTSCAPREVSALTGAVLLTPRAAFEALNGFDEQMAMAFQDVDYGLRLQRIGLINLFEPASILIHMESASVRALDPNGGIQRKRQAERTRFVQRWGDLILNDPLHPRGFDIEDESLRRLSGPDGRRPSRRG